LQARQIILKDLNQKIANTPIANIIAIYYVVRRLFKAIKEIITFKSI